MGWRRGGKHEFGVKSIVDKEIVFLFPQTMGTFPYKGFTGNCYNGKQKEQQKRQPQGREPFYKDLTVADRLLTNRP